MTATGLMLDRSAPVFVFAPGRSGSTLVQRLLNTNEALHIWGEHAGLITPLASSFNLITAPERMHLVCHTPRDVDEKIQNSEPVFDRANWSSQWYNSFRGNDILIAYSGLIERLFAVGVKNTARHWGFKEIRYGLHEAKFLVTLFDKSKFVLVIRSPIEIVRSQLENFYVRNSSDQKLTNIDGLRLAVLQALASVARIDELRKSTLAARCMLLSYEKLTADPMGTLGTVSSHLELGPFDSGKAERIIFEKKDPAAAAWWRRDVEAWLEKQLANDIELAERLNKAKAAFEYD